MKKKIALISAVVFVFLAASLVLLAENRSGIPVDKGEFVTANNKLYYEIGGTKHMGWFEHEGKKYYASSVTNVVVNFDKVIGGKQYLWNDETGLVLADGFVADDVGTKCYDDGYPVIGWRHTDGSGPKVENGISEQYSTNPEGLYYFLSTTGYMVTDETYTLGGYLREFNTDHTVKPLNGLQNRYGELYFYVNGIVQTGWQTIDGVTYYFRASDDVYGRAATKWMYIGNKVYYFYASTSATPYALKTEGAIGGITYEYHEDGYIIYDGFVNVDFANEANNNTAPNIQKKNTTTRYYVDGEMQTGWQTINGNTYYFYAIGSSMGSGYMCCESRLIGGVWYEFTEDGACSNYECKHANTEIIASKAPTCTETGLTEGKKCSVCGEILVAQEVIPATGHTYIDGVCHCGAKDESVKYSEGLEYERLYYGTYKVVGIGTCTDTDIVIPKYYNGELVTRIGNYAFRDCNSLTSITIPSSVTKIESSAFYDCTGLTSITIPDSVTSIGYYAFYGCSSLASITIPNGVTSIGYSAFDGCTSLTSITIPESVTSIDGAFHGCSSLISINIPDGVTSIGNYTFYDCSSLTSINIPEGVTSIGSWAFSGCSGITNLSVDKNNSVYYSEGNCIIEKATKKLIFGCKTSIIPDGVTSIEERAFDGCTGLTSITIPSSVTSIGDGAFFKCSKLTSITIPDGVTSIENSAFYGCTDLTSITIPDGVTSIGYCAFNRCTSLTSITIPNSVTSIGDWAFYGCTGLTNITIPNNVISIGIGVFGGCTGLTSITIPDSVTSIGDSAFEDCTSLTSITIPNSVTSIGDSAFYGCSSLTDIWCEAISKPSGWNSDWKYYCSATVHWDDEWEYVDGVPTLK